MISFKTGLKKTEQSSVFKNWKKNHPEAYLSYGFYMIDPNIRAEWQLGYYNPLLDKITTFIVGEEILKNPDADIFKDKRVLKLNIAKVKVELDEALQKAEDLRIKKYSAYIPVKKIIILQNLEIGQIWNITLITQAIKTINIKIGSETGEVIKHELMDLFKIEK